MRTGLLLINLGTPDSPEVADVRRYLREFLSDPRVIDLPAPARWLLLNLIILPFRPRRSAAAYRTVFTERGSPLLVHGQDLAAAVAQELGQGWRVALGMRYGRPDLDSALRALEACERVVVLPLFPQYSSAATGSALERVLALAGGRPVVPALTLVREFFTHPAFIEAQAALAAPLVAQDPPDHVLFSFHGLPERQVRAACPGVCLASPGCCEQVEDRNRGCYRAQCVGTAKALAAALGLPAGGWSVGFQSRLGRDPWIGPHTEDLLPTLAQGGVRHLLVLCPSFVADCLETLEELGERGRAAFLGAGGARFTLAPCVNASALWAAGVARLAREALGAVTPP